MRKFSRIVVQVCAVLCLLILVGCFIAVLRIVLEPDETVNLEAVEFKANAESDFNPLKLVKPKSNTVLSDISPIDVKSIVETVNQEKKQEEQKFLRDIEIESTGETIQYNLADLATWVMYDFVEELEYDPHGRAGDLFVLYKIYDSYYNLNTKSICGILGNVACEAECARIQGTSSCYTSYDDIIKALPNTGYGVGLIQWTSADRQENLRSYYEQCRDLDIPFQFGKLIAETACLYDELVSKGYFEYITDSTSSEQCTGWFARKIEAYNNSYYQWTSNYTFKGNSRCSGYQRLMYSKHLEGILEELDYDV